MGLNWAGLIAGMCLGLVLIGGRPACGADDDVASAGLIALGGAYSAIADGALVWVNPALPALSGQRGIADFSYRRLYELDELEEITAGVWQRVRQWGGLGLGFSRFGESGLYLETRAVVAASWAPRKNWAVGGGWEVRRIEFGEGEQRYGGSDLTLAAAARPISSVLAAAAWRRIQLNPLYDGDNQESVVEVSASWSAPPDITLAGIWTAQAGEDQFGLGQRLHLGSGIEFLSGLTFDPIRYSLGGRIAYAGGVIDYAYQSHADLGGTHVIGFGWRW
jgi:hypothetical protein